MEALKFEVTEWGNRSLEITPDIISCFLEKEQKELENSINELFNKREAVVKHIFKILNIEFVTDNLKRITRILPEKYGDYEQYFLDYETINRIHLFNYRLKEGEIVRTDNSFKIESYMEFKSKFDISEIIN